MYGNEYFKKSLKDYRDIGLGYDDLWKNAEQNFQQFSQGTSDQGPSHYKE